MGIVNIALVRPQLRQFEMPCGSLVRATRSQGKDVTLMTLTNTSLVCLQRNLQSCLGIKVILSPTKENITFIATFCWSTLLTEHVTLVPPTQGRVLTILVRGCAQNTLPSWRPGEGQVWPTLLQCVLVLPWSWVLLDLPLQASQWLGKANGSTRCFKWPTTSQVAPPPPIILATSSSKNWKAQHPVAKNGKSMLFY